MAALAWMQTDSGSRADEPHPHVGQVVVGEYLLSVGAGTEPGFVRADPATEEDRARVRAFALADLNAATEPGLASVGQVEDALPRKVLDDFHALEQAIGEGQWADVLRLGHAVEAALILSGQWGAWGQALQWMGHAARKLHDQRAEARALHQAGVRALCLEDVPAARANLIRAFRLQQVCDDRQGALITCHHLDLLLGPPDLRPTLPAPGLETMGGPRPPALVSKALITIGLAALVVIVLVLGIWGTVYVWTRPAPTASLTQVVLATPSSSAASAWTPAPTLTHPPTAVPASTPPPSTPTVGLTPTPTPVPDTIGPSAPRLTSPAMDARLTCPASLGSLTVQLQWGAVTDTSGVVGYQVHVRVIQPGPSTYPARSVIGTSVEMSLPCNKTYLWKVRARDGAGNDGFWSEERTLSVRDTTAPPVPVMVQPQEGAEFACPTGRPIPVGLGWSAVADPSGLLRYEVEVSEYPDLLSSPGVAKPVSSLRQLPPSQLRLSVDGLCGRAYTWRIRAVDSVGNVGTWSAAARFRILPAPPDLAVTTFLVTAPPTLDEAGQVRVPVHLAVKNGGGTAAGAFRVMSVYTWERGGPFAVTFEGAEVTDALLAPGSERMFDGEVIFPPALQGQTVVLQLWADACTGEAGLPAHCRVQESDEGNNASPAMAVPLPKLVLLTLRPTADASVDSRSPGSRLGMAEILDVGTYVDAQNRFSAARSLLRFDLTAIPAGAAVRRATLFVEVDSRWSGEGDDFRIEVVRLLSAWDEEQVNWETLPDYAPLQASSLLLDTGVLPAYEVLPAVLGRGASGCEWDVTALVQDWVNGTANYGLALIGPEQPMDNRRTFYSRESDHAPRLTVEYAFVPPQQGGYGVQFSSYGQR